MSKQDNYSDVVIVGGGVAGILLASRLQSSFSGSVLLLNSQSSFGGRSRFVNWEKKEWSPSPGLISKKLHDFISNFYLSNPSQSGDDIPDFREASFGLFVQNKLLPFKSLSDKESKIPKTLGGLAAQKQWLNLWDNMFGSLGGDESPLSKSIGLNSKDSLAGTLKLMSSTLGLSSWLSASPRALKERSEYYNSLGSSLFLEDLSGFLCENKSENFSLALDEKVISASKKDDLWILKTTKRSLETKRLVVAHSPWEALSWLDRKNFPAGVLKMALRSKPASLVLLTKKLLTPCENLPDQIIVASESVLVYKSSDSLCFTCTLDYESSISAPEVTKSIKSLRRAAIKLCKQFSELQLDEEALALFPISWGQSAGIKDLDLVEKLSDYNFFKKDLLFCGESYGASYRPDDNVIKSVLACDRFCTEHELGE